MLKTESTRDSSNKLDNINLTLLRTQLSCFQFAEKKLEG